MGMYDYLISPCPKCGNNFLIQTKATLNPSISTYHLGESPEFNLALGSTFTLLLKQECEDCASPVVLKVVDGKISEFTSEGAEYKEDYWGIVKKL